MDVQVGDVRDQRIRGVWVAEEGGEREDDFQDGESWRPIILEDVETDPTGFRLKWVCERKDKTEVETRGQLRRSRVARTEPQYLRRCSDTPW